MNNYIILLVGRSGSGKDTVAKYMSDHYGYKKLISYTTRPQRNEEDLNNHIFITEEDFDKLEKEENIVAYTKFDDKRYCATESQVEQSDIYVIDPSGVEYFIEKYKGNKEPLIIYLASDYGICYNRMKGRGDSEESIMKRMMNDEIQFKWFDNYDILIDARNAVEYIGDFIHSYCESYTRKNPNQSYSYDYCENI